MTIQEEIAIVGQTPIAPANVQESLEEFVKEYESWGYRFPRNHCVLLSMVYNYGVIQGKREERARRRRNKEGVLDDESFQECQGNPD